MVSCAPTGYPQGVWKTCGKVHQVSAESVCMRLIPKVFLVCLVALLAAGPVLAAPVTLSASPTVSAPAAPTPLRSALNVVLSLLGAAAVGITISKDTGTLAKKFVTRATAA